MMVDNVGGGNVESLSNQAEAQPPDIEASQDLHNPPETSTPVHSKENSDVDDLFSDSEEYSKLMVKHGILLMRN